MSETRITEASLTRAATVAATDDVRVVTGGVSQRALVTTIADAMSSYLSGTLGFLTSATIGSGLANYQALAAKTGNYQMTTADSIILVDLATAAANVAVTLPTAAETWDAANSKGQVFTVKISAGSGAYKIVLTPQGASTIDGAATFELASGSTPELFASVVSDGTDWWIVGG